MVVSLRNYKAKTFPEFVFGLLVKIQES